MNSLSRKEILELYKELPPELKEAIFSSEVADNIYLACQKNGIASPIIISSIAKIVGNVFLGLLSPDNLAKEIIKKTRIKKDIAEKIYKQINDTVFLQLKNILEKLYETEIKQFFSPQEIKVLTGKDPYREPIE